MRVVVKMNALQNLKEIIKHKPDGATHIATSVGKIRYLKHNVRRDFVYYDGAAVLQTHADIYGVFVTDKMHELNKQAEAYKKVPTDMVQVEIRGKITDKKDEQILWEQKVEIIEILKVSPPKDGENDVVKLGS